MSERVLIRRSVPRDRGLGANWGSPVAYRQSPIPPEMAAVYQTRQELITKLLHSQEPQLERTEPISTGGSSRSRQWDTIESFVEDNLVEVYSKLPSLEKQIWGKLIVMEGSRRTAKAYLRHPILTLDGSDTEFDGLRIGLSRFPNPERSQVFTPSISDAAVEVVYDVFNEMLSGVKVKIDPDGNVWAKRMCLSPVFLKPLYRNRPNDLFLIDQRPVKVFDIRRFKEILVDELRQPNPDRARLERCCLVCLKISVDHPDLLQTPLWIVVVHLVAVELLNLVLPKDQELSSPSGSFMSPTPSSQELYNDTPPRSGIGRAERGGVVKRMLRGNPMPQLPNDLHRSPPSASAYRGESEGRGRAWPEPPPELNGARSLLDLRQLNQHYAPVYFAGNRKSRLGDRVFSLEALNQDQEPQTNQSAAFAAAVERQYRLKKWKSQDSGIGSGSYGSK